MMDLDNYKELTKEEVFQPITEYWKEKNPTVYRLFKDKDKNTATVEMLFFYKCPMDCNFCWQPHKETAGFSVEEMHQKTDVVCEYIDQVDSDKIAVTYFGGELLADWISDDFFQCYKDMAKKLNDACLRNDKVLHICLPSNLLVRKLDRIKSLFDYFESLEISYDLEMSYNWMNMYKNDAQVKLAKKNEKEMEKYIKIINTVISKDLIEKLCEGEEDAIDPYYTYLYNKYRCNHIIYFSSNFYGTDGKLYTSKDKDVTYKPLDQEKILKAYKWLFDNYPNIDVYKDYMHTVMNPGFRKELECPNNRMAISPEGKIHYCMPYNQCKNGELFLKFCESRQCFSCEYFEGCRAGGECFFEEMDPKMKLTSECMYKLLFNYMKEQYDSNLLSIGVDDTGYVQHIARKK